MKQFDKNKIEELKDYLYHSESHDAVLKNSQYDKNHKTLYIDIFNPIFNVEIHFVFCDVKVLSLINCKTLGNSESVYSLSVEEDYSYLKSCFHINDNELDNALYLLFEMFSGQQLHIVFKEVLIDIKKD